MDTLTFASPILLKHLTFSEQKKMPVHQVDLSKALEGLGLSMDQFIDLCILLGCDYMEPVKGIGPKTAFKLIKEYGSIEKVKEHLEEKEEEKRQEAERKGKDKARGVAFPEVWPYKEAREIFKHPDILKGDDMDVSNARAHECRYDDMLIARFSLSSSNGRLQTSRDSSSSSAQTRASTRIACERAQRSCKRRSARSSKGAWTAFSNRRARQNARSTKRTPKAKRAVVPRTPRRRRRNEAWLYGRASSTWT